MLCCEYERGGNAQLDLRISIVERDLDVSRPSIGRHANQRKVVRSRDPITAVNRHLEFDAVGFLRLLVRRGHLQAVGKGEYERTGSWPPPAKLWSKPVGITNCVQTWFRYLQQWITSSMGQLESKEGVYSLDCRGEYGSGAS